MKINTHIQNNNMSFGVKMKLKKATVGNLKKHVLRHPTPKHVLCQKIHMLIARHIENSHNSQSLSSCFKNLKEGTKLIRENCNLLDAFVKSGKTLEQTFYETCDNLFDVQLINDDGGNILYDTGNFNGTRTRVSSEEKKKIIASCIEHCGTGAIRYRGVKNIDAVCNHIKNSEGINCTRAIVKNYLSAISRISNEYKIFISQPTGKKTFANFQEYVTNSAKHSTYLAIYKNSELFKYTIEKINEKNPEQALTFEEE